MKQVIYLDVLIFLNTAITFILLLACSRIMKLTPSAGRYVMGSLLGGIFSLIIFAPDMGIILSLVTKLVFSLIMVFIVYNPKRLKNAFRQAGYFFSVSFVFAGIMLFVSSLPGISIIRYNNGIAYIDFSITSLILSAVVCYVVTCILNKITRHSHDGEVLYNIKIKNNNKTVSLASILDTGNNLIDPFNGESLIIASKSDIWNLLPFGIQNYISDDTENCESVRLVPCSTIAGESLLPVFRAEEVVISGDRMNRHLVNVGIAVCAQEIGNVILPANIFDK